MKRDVAANNTAFKISDIKRLASDATDRISQETISKTIKHAEKIEQEYWKKDGLRIINPPVEPVRIQIDDSSSESSDSDSDIEYE